MGVFMKTIFDITEFGAVGDGKTDCTAAVQKALDAASECMGKVIVPPGTYMVGHLKMHGSNVCLEGTSAWGFNCSGSSIFSLNDADADCMIDISGAFGGTIRGMSLSGNDLGTNIHGVKLYWKKYNGGGKEDSPTIDDCRIEHFSGNGLHFEHIWCFSVRHCMLCFCGGAGLYMDGCDAFIIDNWLTCNKEGGLLGGPIVSSITCTGNRVEWNSRGGFILPGGDSYNITGNFFDRSFGPAVELGCEGNSVDLAALTGNIFRRSGALRVGESFENPDHSCHLLMKNCSGVTVTGNAMRTGQDDDHIGIMTPEYSIIMEDCESCIVKDNTMHKGALTENLILRGDLTDCVIKDTIGSIGEWYYPVVDT